VLFHLIQDAANERESPFAPAETYMQFAIYDLLGALFAAPDLPARSSHTNSLFKRISRIINNRFADPAFGPSEAAAEAGISLRYLQKLFTARGSCCTHVLQAVRLDHAARQLHRRTLLGPSRTISEIAYASGFSDYTHFARQFRRRFGHPPVAHVPGDGYHDDYLPASATMLESTLNDELYSSRGKDSLRAIRQARAIREDAA
jgi:AraC-like DNA-binding protein